MEFSNDLQILARDLETALTGLVKLIKALSFYPANHPSLETVAEEACRDFQPLLKHHGTRPYHITKKGFSLDAELLAPKNKNLEILALKLVERRVRHLLFLPELANYELLMFAEELTKPAAELFAAGGLAKRLTQRRIKSILINETDLNKISASRQIYEDQPAEDETFKNEPGKESRIPPAPEQQTNADRMRETLEQLKDPLDNQRYQSLLNEVQQLSHAFFSRTGIPGYLAVLNLLESHRKDSTRPTTQQQAADSLVDLLLSEATCRTLVDAIADSNIKASQHRSLIRLTIGLGEKISPQLLNRLYAERDAVIRRHYSDILAHMGETIFDLLREDLHSDIWHQVRNVVSILGKTRLDSALPLLTQVIRHPEVRVRRAVIHALAAIGGNSVIPLLLELGQDSDEELHQPAIMALGTLKNPRAIPPLANILKRTDLLGKNTKLKSEVIQALAATGSPQAIIPLLKQARRTNLLKHKRIEILRAEAILALGQLGNYQLLPLLETLPRCEKEPVSRALKQVTEQFRKQQNVT